jgi:hypothetical protein
MASVVISSPAIEAAPCKALRTTLVGSMTPWLVRSPYSPVSPQELDHGKLALGLGFVQRDRFRPLAPQLELPALDIQNASALALQQLLPPMGQLIKAIQGLVRAASILDDFSTAVLPVAGDGVAQFFSKISGTLAEELARVFKPLLTGEGKKRVSGVNAAHEVSRQHILKRFALGAEGLAGRFNAFLKPGHSSLMG